MVNEAKAAAKMEDKGGACANKEVDCKSVVGGAGVDMNKLRGAHQKLLARLSKSNLRKAFTETYILETSILDALLSLASNPMLKDIHECMCSGGSGGNGSVGIVGESGKMANAMDTVGPKGLRDKK